MDTEHEQPHQQEKTQIFAYDNKYKYQVKRNHS